MAVNRFERVRQDHSREIAEDYVELIAALVSESREARIVDLAERLGVSSVTVSKTIQRLAREGLVNAAPYRSVFLTPEGEALAERARKRHEIVRGFLVKIGVSTEQAEIDSEGIEHHVSEETLAAMAAFVLRS